MRNLSRMLGLPASLLVLIACPSWQTSLESRWPYNLPAHIKYYPEDEIHVKRGLEAMEKLSTRSPIGARKIPADRHEMFFMEYWQFEDSLYDPNHSLGAPDTKEQLVKRVDSTNFANETLGLNLLPPLLPHSLQTGRHDSQGTLRFLPRSNLFARDFQCPAGTNSCSSISRPYSCCATDETCVLVDNLDAGMGDVGCCAKGATCGGQVAECNVKQGYTACRASPNGGCCIPNYTCLGVGCVSVGGTATTTTTLPTATVTACTSGFQTCPASLGGGCCPNAAACGSSTSCRPTSSSTSSTIPAPVATTSASSSTRGTTAAAGAPLRPTGATNSNDGVLASTTTVGTSLIAVCPTGFYFCSAYYRPGCCQVGLDCALSNCPAAASSSTLVSNGVTIVVPGGLTTGGTPYVTTALITGVSGLPTSTVKNGACPAGGWSSCAADVGGGCCPPNFSCGTVCTASGAGATGVVNKLEPSEGRRLRSEYLGFVWLILCAGFGVGMVVL